MRLISKFRDFYDCIQATGYGEYPVYVREHKQIKRFEIVHNEIKDVETRKHVKSVFSIVKSLPGTPTPVEKGVVFFCGRAYPFYKFEEKCYYDIDKLKDAMILATRYRSCHCRDEIKAFFAKTENPSKKKWRYFRTPDLNRVTWNNFLNETSMDVPVEIFRYFSSPIIATSFVKGVFLEINPVLRDYSFEQVKDPYSAWQEISMFLGSDLANQKDPNPPISDVLKAQAKGFDCWSFRRQSDEGRKVRKR